MLVVISPHLDDAVFSCGALLATHQTRVVTVCAGIPPESVPPSHFDEMAGFRTAADAIRRRRVEDLQAAEILGAEMVHGDLLQQNYAAESSKGRAARIRELVADALSELTSDDVALGPLGLRHPDHELVAEAFSQVTGRSAGNAWLYEELPYRALWPEYLKPALKRARCEAGSEYFSDTAPAIKHRALRCYTSQLVGMDTQPLLLPERYHRLSGEASLW